MRFNNHYHESAVSPVIGVLLMLVVTIIIAAIVSGFAGGIAGSQQKAPQASFDVKTQYPVDGAGGSTKTGFDLYFIHRGGDTINTKNTQIITYLTLPNGSVVQHKQTPTSTLIWNGTTGTNAGYIRYPFYRDSMGAASQSRTYDQVQAGSTSPVWFGEVSISTGQSLRVDKLTGVAAFLGLVSESGMYPFDSAAYQAGMDLLNQSITNKTRLDVKMLDIPSQKYIFEKSINLEG